MAGVSGVRQSSYTEELSFFYKNAYDDFFGKEHEFLTLDSSLPKDMQVSFLTRVQRCAGDKEREIVRKALKALVVTLVRERDDLQIENLRLQVELSRFKSGTTVHARTSSSPRASWRSCC